MLWIYIPPVILVIALAALAVILGRKSAHIKKIAMQAEMDEQQSSSKNWGERFKSIGQSSLHILEKTLGLLKTIFKKTEQLFSGWSKKLQAKRKGKDADEIIFSDLEGTEENSHDIRKKDSPEEVRLEKNLEKSENVRYIGSEVVVRRKAEEPVILAKKEPLPEDKVREAALIYRIAENPRDIEAYREIGDYYLGIGNIKDAKESFKMVLKLRPRDLKAKSSLREIEMRMRLGN